MITYLRRIQPDAGFQHRLCAQFCAYDRLGAVGKSSESLTFLGLARAQETPA
jgi:hypothetical protein